MDLDSLRTLAYQGFAGIKGDQLGDLAEWCRDYSEATGDARYASIGQALSELSEWWSWHDRSGGIPFRLMSEIEGIIKERLPEILAAASARDAAPLARNFRREIERRLSDPEDWVADGYVGT
jgi:hypothetical protein